MLCVGGRNRRVYLIHKNDYVYAKLDIEEKYDHCIVNVNLVDRRFPLPIAFYIVVYMIITGCVMCIPFFVHCTLETNLAFILAYFILTLGNVVEERLVKRDFFRNVSILVKLALEDN